MQKSFLPALLFWLCACVGQCEEAPPLYDEVMKIMEPLEYSGVPAIVKPQASLSIDFGKRQWTLHNIHEYDGQGRIILEENRYGLCAELATYLFEKIRDLFGARYLLKFAMAGEAGFFGAGRSNHIVLIVIDKANGQVYLMDPSFHKYARKRDLPEYQVINLQDSLSFVKDQSHDASFGVDQSVPLFIKKDFLLTVSVTSVDGKFDRDNFIFVVAATERYKFGGRDILLVGRRNGQLVDFEDKPLFEQLLSPQETNVLFTKMKSWLQAV